MAMCDSVGIVHYATVAGERRSNVRWSNNTEQLPGRVEAGSNRPDVAG